MGSSDLQQYEDQETKKVNGVDHFNFGENRFSIAGENREDMNKLPQNNMRIKDI